ncbi:protein arginine N-methyltransferase 9-like [Ruditapes philippinarum]|uniref:protein arginine N-methyltransferase 9-like n=1 Tax=Ruditapes philippinarum TaxID=129788 RepID=UPI00295C0E3D|nr:protein arginine N-methyltransferase 9-like [Ruditapes philippinarum]
MSNVAKIAQISLLNARNCLQTENYGRAFANFLLYLKLRSDCAADVYTEFALATREWCEQLEEQKRLQDLFKCYDQACELYPDHDVVLNNIGAQLFRLGYVEEAAAYIRKSLLVNPNYLAARDNLENVCSHLVERWHFSMLNDKRRNIAFKFAIDKAIKSGYNTVLDIGTGTGILSMMSEFSGAVEVTACDGSRAMIDVAHDVLQANGVFHKINLLHKHSTDIEIPSHLSSRVKLVVTETFDAGLFGEHIVSTLIHAWKNLISTSPMGTVIPCGATMYVCGIECETIRTQSRLLYPVLQNLDVSHINLLCNTGHIAEEPYTTENLAKIRGGYKILTNIVELLRVSFCNLCELEALHKGKDWLCDLFVKQDGRLDALAVWFDLHLDDTITIGTGADKNSCWEQAIYPVTSISRKQSNSHENCHVKRKEKVRATFHYECDCLRLSKCEAAQNEQFKTTLAKHVKDHNLASSISKTSDVFKTCSGTSVKECSTNCLPFRKRKVESCESDIYTCNCEANIDGNGLDGENVLENKRTNICDDVETGGIGNTHYSQCHNVDTNCSASQEFENSSNITNLCTLEENKTDNYEQVAACINQEIDIISNPCVIENNEKSTSYLDVDREMEKCSLDIDNTDTHVTTSIVGRKTRLTETFDAMPPLEYMDSATVAGKYPHTVPKLISYAEQVDIEYVNDIQLNRHYCHVLESYRAQKPGSYLSFLYISPHLSFLGIQAAKMGYNRVTMATPEEHHNTLHQVAALNGCKPGEIILTELSDLNDLEMKVDVIVCDVVEPCGALRQQVFEDLVYHRIASLKKDGLILPAEVKIHGLFIESEELESLSHVTGNDRTLGFQIADFINVFQMQNHMNIDMTSLNYTRLTDVQEILTIDISGISAKTTKNDLEQTVERSVEVVTSGKITALVYWFELRLNKDIVISTLDSRCHWKQAGIIIKDDVSMVTGQHIVSKITLQNSCLDVKIIQPNNVNGQA